MPKCRIASEDMPDWHDLVRGDIVSRSRVHTMNLRALQYFVSAASLNSISKAAAHLHVAQPALSRQIHKLERELGAQLLRRDSTGVRLRSRVAYLR